MPRAACRVPRARKRWLQRRRGRGRSHGAGAINEQRCGEEGFDFADFGNRDEAASGGCGTRAVGLLELFKYQVAGTVCVLSTLDAGELVGGEGDDRPSAEASFNCDDATVGYGINRFGR